VVASLGSARRARWVRGLGDGSLECNDKAGERLSDGREKGEAFAGRGKLGELQNSKGRVNTRLDRLLTSFWEQGHSLV